MKSSWRKQTDGKGSARGLEFFYVPGIVTLAKPQLGFPSDLKATRIVGEKKQVADASTKNIPR